MPCNFTIDKLLPQNLASLYFAGEEKHLYEQICMYDFNILIRDYTREALLVIKADVSKAKGMGIYILDIYLQMIEGQLKNRPLI
jgi:hypothetical protein